VLETGLTHRAGSRSAGAGDGHSRRRRSRLTGPASVFHPHAAIAQTSSGGRSSTPTVRARHQHQDRADRLAWTQIVALAANLLACYRHLALPAGELRDAAPKQSPGKSRQAARRKR
jgi:hypothetical protein